MLSQKKLCTSDSSRAHCEVQPDRMLSVEISQLRYHSWVIVFEISRMGGSTDWGLNPCKVCPLSCFCINLLWAGCRQLNPNGIRDFVRCNTPLSRYQHLCPDINISVQISTLISRKVLGQIFLRAFPSQSHLNRQPRPHYDAFCAEHHISFRCS